MNQLSERQSSYKRRSNLWLGPGETDVFDDLPDDPPPPAAMAATHVQKTEALAAAARTLEVPPIPSTGDRPTGSRPAQPSQKIEFHNPWQVQKLGDLWQFFHIWLTIIVALEVHASMRLARLEKDLIHLELHPVVVILPVFGLLMLLNWVVWRRCKGLDYRQFFLPLSAITLTGLLLAAAADLLAWMW